MFINKISVSNFRIYPSDIPLVIENINIPNDNEEGTGITAIIGENGCGKTTLLEAFALPLLTYKTDNFNVCDINDPEKKTFIEIFSKDEFEVSNSMPRGSFKAKGFIFEAGLRLRANRDYLSSTVVTDQRFIKADNSKSPKDGSPDLRVSVNNPFLGKRFDENDIIFLDKNRTFQTRSGTYNSTRFDKLMEDFNYQYLKHDDPVQNLNEEIGSKLKEHVENEFISQAIIKFKEISGFDLSLNFIDNWKPFSKCFFADKKNNLQQINLCNIGSGFEMIFSLIYSFFLSCQSRKQLIIIIDEPELHMHPLLQNELVKLLLEISKKSQIILTCQSPLFVKQLLSNKQVKIFILKKEDYIPKVVQMAKLKLPYISSNEVNYFAFNLASVEYHNELYGHIQEHEQKYTENDIESFFVGKSLPKCKSWQREKDGIQIVSAYPVTMQTFIRNKIHHPENRSMQAVEYSQEELQKSITEMLGILI